MSASGWSNCAVMLRPKMCGLELEEPLARREAIGLEEQLEAEIVQVVEGQSTFAGRAFRRGALDGTALVCLGFALAAFFANILVCISGPL